jgi:hypothetical protein
MASGTAPLSSIVHHSEVVLGMLVVVLHLDRIAVALGFPRQRQVPLIVAVRIDGRSILPLPLCAIVPTVRRPPSLRSLIAVAILFHEFDHPCASLE